MEGALEESMASNGTPVTNPEDAADLTTRVAAVLDLIRPAIQSDGGDLELVSVTPDGTVTVRLHGACVGCPSSSLTLQAGIERRLQERIPEVTSVQALE